MHATHYFIDYAGIRRKVGLITVGEGRNTGMSYVALLFPGGIQGMIWVDSSCLVPVK